MAPINAEHAGDGTVPNTEDMGPATGAHCSYPNISTSSNVSEESPNALMSPNAKLNSPIVVSSTAPKVRTSDEKFKNPDAAPSLLSHKKTVNLVAGALYPSPPPENSDPMINDSNGVESDEEGTGEDDFKYEEPKENDEHKDSMTLVQYQSGLRKEALVRKGPQLSAASHKKGRLDAEGMDDQ